MCVCVYDILYTANSKHSKKKIQIYIKYSGSGSGSGTTITTHIIKNYCSILVISTLLGMMFGLIYY